MGPAIPAETAQHDRVPHLGEASAGIRFALDKLERQMHAGTNSDRMAESRAQHNLRAAIDSIQLEPAPRAVPGPVVLTDLLLGLGGAAGAAAAGRHSPLHAPGPALGSPAPAATPVRRAVSPHRPLSPRTLHFTGVMPTPVASVAPNAPASLAAAAAQAAAAHNIHRGSSGATASAVRSPRRSQPPTGSGAAPQQYHRQQPQPQAQPQPQPQSTRRAAPPGPAPFYLVHEVLPSAEARAKAGTAAGSRSDAAPPRQRPAPTASISEATAADVMAMPGRRSPPGAVAATAAAAAARRSISPPGLSLPSGFERLGLVAAAGGSGAGPGSGGGAVSVMPLVIRPHSTGRRYASPAAAAGAPAAPALSGASGGGRYGVTPAAPAVSSLDSILIGRGTSRHAPPADAPPRVAWPPVLDSSGGPVRGSGGGGGGGGGSRGRYMPPARELDGERVSSAIIGIGGASDVRQRPTSPLVPRPQSGTEVTGASVARGLAGARGPADPAATTLRPLGPAAAQAPGLTRPHSVPRGAGMPVVPPPMPLPAAAAAAAFGSPDVAQPSSFSFQPYGVPQSPRRHPSSLRPTGGAGTGAVVDGSSAAGLPDVPTQLASLAAHMEAARRIQNSILGDALAEDDDTGASGSTGQQGGGADTGATGRPALSSSAAAGRAQPLPGSPVWVPPAGSQSERPLPVDAVVVATRRGGSGRDAHKLQPRRRRRGGGDADSIASSTESGDLEEVLIRKSIGAAVGAHAAAVAAAEEVRALAAAAAAGVPTAVATAAVRARSRSTSPTRPGARGSPSAAVDMAPNMVLPPALMLQPPYDVQGPVLLSAESTFWTAAGGGAHGGGDSGGGAIAVASSVWGLRGSPPRPVSTDRGMGASHGGSPGRAAGGAGDGGGGGGRGSYVLEGQMAELLYLQERFAMRREQRRAARAAASDPTAGALPGPGSADGYGQGYEGAGVNGGGGGYGDRGHDGYPDEEEEQEALAAEAAAEEAEALQRELEAQLALEAQLEAAAEQARAAAEAAAAAAAEEEAMAEAVRRRSQLGRERSTGGGSSLRVGSAATAASVASSLRRRSGSPPPPSTRVHSIRSSAAPSRNPSAPPSRHASARPSAAGAPPPWPLHPGAASAGAPSSRNPSAATSRVVSRSVSRAGAAPAAAPAAPGSTTLGATAAAASGAGTAAGSAAGSRLASAHLLSPEALQQLDASTAGLGLGAGLSVSTTRLSAHGSLRSRSPGISHPGGQSAAGAPSTGGGARVPSAGGMSAAGSVAGPGSSRPPTAPRSVAASAGGGNGHQGNGGGTGSPASSTSAFKDLHKMVRDMEQLLSVITEDPNAAAAAAAAAGAAAGAAAAAAAAGGGVGGGNGGSASVASARSAPGSSHAPPGSGGAPASLVHTPAYSSGGGSATSDSDWPYGGGAGGGGAAAAATLRSVSAVGLGRTAGGSAKVSLVGATAGTGHGGSSSGGAPRPGGLSRKCISYTGGMAPAVAGGLSRITSRAGSVAASSKPAVAFRDDDVGRRSSHHQSHAGSDVYPQSSYPPSSVADVAGLRNGAPSAQPPAPSQQHSLPHHHQPPHPSLRPYPSTNAAFPLTTPDAPEVEALAEQLRAVRSNISRIEQQMWPGAHRHSSGAATGSAAGTASAATVSALGVPPAAASAAGSATGGGSAHLRYLHTLQAELEAAAGDGVDGSGGGSEPSRVHARYVPQPVTQYELHGYDSTGSDPIERAWQRQASGAGTVGGGVGRAASAAASGGGAGGGGGPKTASERASEAEALIARAEMLRTSLSMGSSAGRSGGGGAAGAAAAGHVGGSTGGDSSRQGGFSGATGSAPTYGELPRAASHTGSARASAAASRKSLGGTISGRSLGAGGVNGVHVGPGAGAAPAQAAGWAAGPRAGGGEGGQQVDALEAKLLSELGELESALRRIGKGGGGVGAVVGVAGRR
ncbi:hypothetical protein HYH02_001270 [Chlamydomonas schloesseri]|uniref:Uncharacterized protein n=1 Tax=Chlamydomonas schloesseri TaxID=2026947 RepID=A0A836BCA2_9CHLO|nr:hypothetical protein HYH02_001270 [Chlamydomonas schloesseri]|eukprot:KAG2454236.1 hypothetical protein HYH02_001270 [Chlamydomonas schloesseri]